MRFPAVSHDIIERPSGILLWSACKCCSGVRREWRDGKKKSCQRHLPRATGCDQETEHPLDSGFLASQLEWQFQVVIGYVCGPSHYLPADRFIGITHEIVRPVLVRAGLWTINYPRIGYSGTQTQVVVLSPIDQSSTFPLRPPLASISLLGEFVTQSIRIPGFLSSAMRSSSCPFCWHVCTSQPHSLVIG